MYAGSLLGSASASPDTFLFVCFYIYTVIASATLGLFVFNDNNIHYFTSIQYLLQTVVYYVHILRSMLILQHDMGLKHTC